MCSKEGTDAANRAGRHVLCGEAEDTWVGLSGEGQETVCNSLWNQREVLGSAPWELMIEWEQQKAELSA